MSSLIKLTHKGFNHLKSTWIEFLEFVRLISVIVPVCTALSILVRAFPLSLRLRILSFRLPWLSPALAAQGVSDALAQWPIRGQYSGHVICADQSEASVGSVSANQRPGYY